jgi:peptidoglycan/LPS O-acetylase OafA/YrhL
MTPRLSLALDLWRFAAAFVVLASHWAYMRFTGGAHGWIRDHDLGGDAVVVFFVMSGLLVAHAADRRREEGLAAFAADRLSRLWSVALPALALTFALDPLGAALAPAVYPPGFYEADDPALRALAAGGFLNELWFSSVRPGSNGPWWSLGYEAAYYAIFACVFFLRGRARLVAAGAAALIAGPKIWLLAPAWILGAGLWALIRSGRLAAMSRPAAWTLAAGAPAAAIALHLAGVPAGLLAATRSALGPAAMDAIGFSDTFVWAALLGALTSLHLAGCAALAAREGKGAPPRLAAALRWLAGGSFALYLFHYPVLQFAGAALPGAVSDPWRQAALLAIPLVAAYALAELTERRREPLRRALRAAFARAPGGRAALEAGRG